MIDTVVYALTIAAIVFSVGVILGSVLGGGLVTAKFVMFVVGLLLFGYATFQLRPTPPWTIESTEEGETRVVSNETQGAEARSRSETRFQAFVQRIPPLSYYSITPDERVPVATKLFIASLTVLGWSFIMEMVFGVAF